jgi:FMN phosphatase YigB (HAD superfamily)
MKQVLGPNRRKIVHDYDGVHYDYAVVPDIYGFLGEVKVFLAEKLFPTLLEEIGAAELKRIGVESYHKTGDGLRGFVDLAIERLGVDEAEFQRDLHILYNQTNMVRTLQQYPSIFEYCGQTNALMDSLRGYVDHAILTQSCLDNWARPGLIRQQRHDYFKTFVGFAEGGYVTKSHSTRPLETVMRQMNARPEETIFIEDSLPNLKKAKELDDRILTVHICHGQQCAVPDYVDIQARKLPIFLSQLATVHHTPSNRILPTIEMNYNG